MSQAFAGVRELGHIIRYHRKKAGLSRMELSEIAGASPTSIYELEHGKESIQFNIILTILQALNLQLLVDGPLMETYQEDEKG